MGLFYQVPDKELLEIRKKIFLEKGIPQLKRKGFEKSPFSGSWYGRNNLGDYTYEFCRVSNPSNLELIVTHISRGDSWIKIFLNIFHLKPEINSISQLNGMDGIQFDLPPNSITNMRLRSDDVEGIPLFNYHFMFGGYRIRSFHSKKGLQRRTQKLSQLIEKDLGNIDSFVKRWHELHRPLVTDWAGYRID